MDQRERFEAWWVRDVPISYRADVLVMLRKSRDGDGKYGVLRAEDSWLAWQAAEAAALECAITTIQSDSDAVAELGYERYSRYCAEVVAKLRNLAAPLERGGDKS